MCAAYPSIGLMLGLTGRGGGTFSGITAAIGRRVMPGLVGRARVLPADLVSGPAAPTHELGVGRLRGRIRLAAPLASTPSLPEDAAAMIESLKRKLI